MCVRAGAVRAVRAFPSEVSVLFSSIRSFSFFLLFLESMWPLLGVSQTFGKIPYIGSSILISRLLVLSLSLSRVSECRGQKVSLFIQKRKEGRVFREERMLLLLLM